MAKMGRVENMKKALFFIIGILLMLCGCAGKKEEPVLNTVNKEAVYKSRKVTVSLPTEYEDYTVGDIEVGESGLFFWCYKDIKEDDNYARLLAWGHCDKDGRNVKLYDKLSDEDDWDYSINDMINCTDAVAIYYGRGKEFEETEDYCYEEFIGVYDKSGQKKAEIPVDGYYYGGFYTEGRFVLIGYDAVVSWDYINDKTVRKALTGYEWIGKGGSGSIVATYPGEEGITEYVYINPMTLEEEKTIEGLSNIAGNQYEIFSGTADNELLFLDNKSLMGYTPGKEAPVEICNIEYSGLYWGGNVSEIFAEENGDFYATVGVYSNDVECQLIKAIKIPPEEVKDKEEVNVACLGITFSDFESFIGELNSSSDSYFYAVKEYKEEEGSGDLLSPINEFDKDLLADNAPDIIVAESSSLRGNYNINKYVSKGVFLPLNDLLDKDPEIDAEDIFPSLKEACSYDGKMYTIIPNFYIRTMLAKEDLCSDTDNWTYSAFDNVLKAHPDARPFYNAFRDEIISNFLAMENNAFFSLSDGTCNFNTEEFVEFLELLKEYGDDYEHDREDYEYDVKETRAYNEESALFYMAEVYSGEDLFVFGKNVFKGEASVVGYPNNSGLNGYIVPRNYVLAISNKSKNSEAAWQFVRKFLTDEYQAEIEYSIPASMKAFDRLSEKLLAKENIQGWYSNDTVDLGPITKEEVTKVKNLILSSGANLLYDETVVGIIEEEAGAFFKGEKTAEEVAKIIDSRVSIYLKENMKIK